MNNEYKRIITTVGTSLIKSFLNDNNDEYKGEFEDIKSKNIIDKNSVNFDDFKKSISYWLKEKREDEILESSAEIKSLKKIKEKYNCLLDVKFLATDTILSVMAAEIICDYLKQTEDGRERYEFKEEYIIRNTDVYNNKHFKEGVKNLINILESIAYETSIINFSGGYKSLIPYLTIYASIKGLTLCYIYEDSNELIELIPPHLQIDVESINKIGKYLKKINDETGIDYPEELKKSDKNVIELFDICTEPYDGKLITSNLGDMIYKIYQQNNNDKK